MGFYDRITEATQLNVYNFYKPKQNEHDVNGLQIKARKRTDEDLKRQNKGSKFKIKTVVSSRFIVTCYKTVKASNVTWSDSDKIRLKYQKKKKK